MVVTPGVSPLKKPSFDFNSRPNTKMASYSGSSDTLKALLASPATAPPATEFCYADQPLDLRVFRPPVLKKRSPLMLGIVPNTRISSHYSYTGPLALASVFNQNIKNEANSIDLSLHLPSLASKPLSSRRSGRKRREKKSPDFVYNLTYKDLSVKKIVDKKGVSVAVEMLNIPRKITPNVTKTETCVISPGSELVDENNNNIELPKKTDDQDDMFFKLGLNLAFQANHGAASDSNKIMKKSSETKVGGDDDDQQPRNLLLRPLRACRRSRIGQDTAVVQTRTTRNGTKRKVSEDFEEDEEVDQEMIDFQVKDDDPDFEELNTKKNRKNKKVKLNLKDSNSKKKQVDAKNVDNQGEGMFKETGETVIIELACSECGLMMPNRDQLNRHLLYLHGMFPYRCLAVGCGKEFQLMGELGPHVRDQHGDVTVWQCTKCAPGRERVFSTHRGLRHHLWYYHLAGRFGCPLCTYECQAPIDVKKHRYLQHSPTYYCSVEGCGHTFKQRSNLLRHQRTHSGLKPYRCRFDPNKCHYSSEVKIHVIRHVKTVHLRVPMQPAEDHSYEHRSTEEDPEKYIAVVRK